MAGRSAALVARVPWAHTPRLQQLRPFLLTTNVSNKSGNLLFAQRQLESIENVGFWHSFGTVDLNHLRRRPEPVRVGKHLTMLTANSSRLSFGVAVMMPISQQLILCLWSRLAGSVNSL